MYQRAYNSVDKQISQSSAIDKDIQQNRVTNSSFSVSSLSTTFSELVKGHQAVADVFKTTSSQPPVSVTMSASAPTQGFYKSIAEIDTEAKIFLSWVSTLDKEIISWNKITNSEIHIINKLAKYIKATFSGPKSDHSLITKGYQCSEKQAQQQEVIGRVVQMDICSEIEW